MMSKADRISPDAPDHLVLSILDTCGVRPWVMLQIHHPYFFLQEIPLHLNPTFLKFQNTCLHKNAFYIILLWENYIIIRLLHGICSKQRLSDAVLRSVHIHVHFLHLLYPQYCNMRRNIIWRLWYMEKSFWIIKEEIIHSIIGFKYIMWYCLSLNIVKSCTKYVV